jgi:PAS domain S-box-containing protein
MNLPEDKKQNDLRSAAETQLDNAPYDEPRARAAEELLHELQVHQIELRMQNETLRQTQLALSESRDLYLDLYEFAPVCYITLSSGGVIQTINLTGVTLMGIERKKLLKKSFLSLVIPECQPLWIQYMLRTKQGYAKEALELTLKCGDSKMFQAQLNCMVHKDDAGQSIIRMTITDISKIKLAEAARKALENQLRESQKMQAIGTLAGGIAHDFNNALAIILGNAELARQDAAANLPVLQSLEEICKASIRSRSLVQQILSFSRRQPVDMKPIDLVPVIIETERLLRSTLPSRLSLEVNCGEVPPVVADASQIEQLLLNLVTNTMQAMHIGNGHIAIQLETVTLDDKHTYDNLALKDLCYQRTVLRITVSDNGPGMDAATKQRVFEPFFTTKPFGEATGLGLSVAHGIVQGHHGAITVDSEPGKGATFTIYLPLAKAKDYTPSLINPVNEARAPDLSDGPRILYLDDDASVVFLIERMLNRRGIRVACHTNQHTALASLKADPTAIDLVLTDYNMPGMSGLEVARKVRSINPELPVVLTSGYIDEDLSSQAELAGIRELILKADGLEVICDTVLRLTYKGD